MPFDGALHHAVPLQNHQEAVRRALVQLERGGHLRQAERGLAFAKQVENRKSAVESLNFVSALGSCVSHIDPLFRPLSPSLASQMMGRSSTGETDGKGSTCDDGNNGW